MLSKQIYLCFSARVGLDGRARETASGCEGTEESSYQVHGSVGYNSYMEMHVCVCVCVHACAYECESRCRVCRQTTIDFELYTWRMLPDALALLAALI